MVCFLAFAPWKTVEGWLGHAGLGHAPRKALDELAGLQLVEVVLPLEGESEAQRRCVLRPDGPQAAILERLGLRPPWGVRERWLTSAERSMM